jgi:hypothetical protein
VTWLRRHALVVGVAVLGALSFALFTWAEFGYFCDQAGDHDQSCPGFWSSEHLHDWVYNAASNWQSELLFGILLLVILLKIEGAHGADREDT